MSAGQTYFDQETTARILDYTVEVESLRTPDEVLNRLNDIISEKKPIRGPQRRSAWAKKRSAAKKAQAKLATRNRTHTVAEAMRNFTII
jgi:hypothetical protein